MPRDDRPSGPEATPYGPRPGHGGSQRPAPPRHADVPTGRAARRGDPGTDAVRAADLRAEGAPEAEYHPGVAARMPRKRIAGGGVYFDALGRVLFVEPTYKPTLEIPGGVVREDESPRGACVREVREELGIDAPVGALLVVDWVPRQGVWSDSLNFVYAGGVLSPEQIAAFRLPAGELRGFAFLHLADAAPRIRPSLARRVGAALAAADRGRPAYLEFGRPA